jgi:hypothetical protein
MVVRNKCRNKNYAQQTNMDSRDPWFFFFFVLKRFGERFFGLFGFLLLPMFSPKML